MKYQSGRMGMAEGLALAFLITFPLIFLNSPAISLATCGSLAWLPGTLGALVYGIFTYIYTLVLERHPGDLLTVSQMLLGRLGGWLVGLYYTAVFGGTSVLWTREFAENSLLTALPNTAFKEVTLLYGAGAAFFVYAGIEALCRATYIIIPFGITGLLLVLALLFPMYKPMYLLPWQGNGLSTLFDPAVKLLGASSPLALLIILAPAFQTITTVRSALLLGFGASISLRTLSIIVFIMVFGSTVGSERTLPFYEMARLIYINHYIQRVEAFFIILWASVAFLGIALNLYGFLYTIARLFRLPTIRPLIPAAAMIIIELSMLPENSTAVLQVESAFYTWFCAPGAVILPVTLLAASYARDRRKECKRQESS